MPIYTYTTIETNGSEPEIFEVEQPISAPPLEKHPVNGKPVKRIYDSPNINIQYTLGRERELSDTTKIKKAGFKIFERDKISKQYFEK